MNMTTVVRLFVDINRMIKKKVHEKVAQFKLAHRKF